MWFMQSIPRVRCCVLAFALSAALLTDAEIVRADDRSPAPAPAPVSLRPSTARTDNGEFIAPLAQQTQTTYVPQSVALSGPTSIRWWEEGDRIPDGYHTTRRVRTGAVVGGSVLFGALYFLSAAFASASMDVAKAEKTTSDDIPLFVPAIGPFARMVTTSSATGGYVLAIDGAGQCAGLALLIYGLTVPKTVLVRNDLAKVVVLPMRMSQGSYGVAVRAPF